MTLHLSGLLAPITISSISDPSNDDFFALRGFQLTVEEDDYTCDCVLQPRPTDEDMEKTNVCVWMKVFSSHMWHRHMAEQAFRSPYNPQGPAINPPPWVYRFAPQV
ncbi:UNVERIFIED_CONTAM: hypothetical protein K2H54_043536 [Gekko kuhli]